MEEENLTEIIKQQILADILQPMFHSNRGNKLTEALCQGMYTLAELQLKTLLDNALPKSLQHEELTDEAIKGITLSGPKSIG